MSNEPTTTNSAFSSPDTFVKVDGEESIPVTSTYPATADPSVVKSIDDFVKDPSTGVEYTANILGGYGPRTTEVKNTSDLPKADVSASKDDDLDDEFEDDDEDENEDDDEDDDDDDEDDEVYEQSRIETF